jgi:hypothetical protein
MPSQSTIRRPRVQPIPAESWSDIAAMLDAADTPDDLRRELDRYLAERRAAYTLAVNRSRREYRVVRAGELLSLAVVSLACAAYAATAFAAFVLIGF